jgi:hypothetical protein
MLPVAILLLAENPYDPTKDVLYRAYLLFTIIGVLIALGGIGVLWWQTGQIRTQTEHLQKQISIQQRSSRQWVNVTDWHQQAVVARPNTIEIAFQIKNPTSIPLRLDIVMSKASGQSNDSGLVTFLAPDNPFPHELYVTLTTEQLTHYEQGKLVLDTEISVFFTDAFDNQWNQTFQRILVCGRYENYIYVRESRTRMHRSGPNGPREDST